MAGMHSVAELTVLVNTKVGKMLGKDLLAADLKSVSGMYQKASVEAAKLAQTRQRDMEKAQRDMERMGRARDLADRRKKDSVDKLVKLETDAGRRIAKIEQQRDAQLAANAEKQMRSAENVSRYQLRQMTQGKRLSSEQALALQQRIAREERDYRKLEADKVRISTGSAEEIARIRIAKDNEVTRVQARNLATLTEAQKKLAEAQIAAGAARTESALAGSAATRAAAKANLAASLAPVGRFATRGVLGTAAVALGSAWESMKYQRSLSQMQAQTPLSDRQREMVGRYALTQGAATGINPQDVLDSFRYASDKLGPQAVRSGLARRTVNVAMQTALPAGVPTSDVTSALTTAMVAFPEYRNRPRAVANMLLTASRAGRMDFSQMVENMPMVMAMASSMGVPLSQAGAMFAQGTRSMTPARFQTQEYDLMQHIAQPSPKSQKLLDQLAKRGVDLRWDFSYQGQKQIGTMGVINDMRRAGLSNDIIMQLVPNLRGSFGAMLLTGTDQNRQMNEIHRSMLRSQTTNPVGQSFTRYLGLDTTKVAEFERSIQKLSIEMGKDVTPVTRGWLAALLNVTKTTAKWLHQNQDIVRSFARMLPMLLGVVGALKGFAILLRITRWANEVVTSIKAIGLAGTLMGNQVKKGAETSITGLEAEGTAATATEAKIAGVGEAGTLMGTKVAAGAEAAAGTEGAMVGAAGGGFAYKGGSGLLRTLGVIGAAVAGLYLLGKASEKLFGKGSLYQDKDGNLNLYDNPMTRRLAQNARDRTYSRAAIAALKTTHAPLGWHPDTPGFVGLPGGRIDPSQWKQPLYGPNGPEAGILYGRTYSNESGVFHWDVPGGQGKPFYLPGGKGTQYKVIGLAPHPAGDDDPGYVVTYQGPNGAVFTLGNVATLPGVASGLKSKFGMSSLLTGGMYGGRLGAGAHGSHLHIAGNQAALNLFKFLHGGRDMVPAAGGAGGHHVSIPARVKRDFPKVAAWWPWLVEAAKRQKIDPYILASVMASESAGDINAKPTYHDGVTDYGLFQYGPAEAALVGGKWGPHVSARDQIATAAALLGSPAYGLDRWNGPAEARIVRARAKGWHGSRMVGGTAPGGHKGGGKDPYGTKSGIGHKPAADPLLADWPPTDPAGWAQWYATVAGATLDSIHDRWGAHPNPKTMTDAGRRSYYKQVNDYIRWTFAGRIATYRSQPWLPDQRGSIAAAQRGQRYYLAHQQAFMTLGEQAGGPPTTPAEWQQYYSGQESKLAGWFTNRWGANPDPSRMNAADRKTYHAQAHQLATWFFRERIADYRANPTVAGAAANLATAQDQLRFFSAHPDRFVNRYILNRGAVNAAAVRYGHLSSRESHLASVIRSGWSGTDPSRMPEWGGGGINQHAWLKAQFKANQLEREARDNHWRQMRALHQISKNTLKTYLEIDKQALNRRNREARQRAFMGAGASGSVVPVHVIGRCAAEEANRKHHAKTASGTHEVAKNTAKTNSLLDNIRRDWHRNHRADQKHKKSMHRKVVRGGSAGGMHATIIEQLPGA
jgi:hypothetical protein